MEGKRPGVRRKENNDYLDQLNGNRRLEGRKGKQRKLEFTAGQRFDNQLKRCLIYCEWQQRARAEEIGVRC